MGEEGTLTQGGLVSLGKVPAYEVDATAKEHTSPPSPSPSPPHKTMPPPVSGRAREGGGGKVARGGTASECWQHRGH